MRVRFISSRYYRRTSFSVLNMHTIAEVGQIRKSQGKDTSHVFRVL